MSVTPLLTNFSSKQEKRCERQYAEKKNLPPNKPAKGKTSISDRPMASFYPQSVPGTPKVKAPFPSETAS